MEQDEIIEMAIQAGFKRPNPHDGYMGLAYDRRDGTDTGSSLEAFAKLAAAKAAEKERDRVANDARHIIKRAEECGVAEERERIHKVMRDAWEDKDWLLISNELNAPDGKIET